MTIPTNCDIYHLLEQLDHSIADDLESNVLDFKPWDDPKEDMKVAIEYAVCFSNAEGGVVVFGVITIF
jgi:ATP-dependent DNA helicase RecG